MNVRIKQFGDFADVLFLSREKKKRSQKQIKYLCWSALTWWNHWHFRDHNCHTSTTGWENLSKPYLLSISTLSHFLNLFLHFSGLWYFISIFYDAFKTDYNAKYVRNMMHVCLGCWEVYKDIDIKMMKGKCCSCTLPLMQYVSFISFVCVCMCGGGGVLYLFTSWLTDRKWGKREGETNVSVGFQLKTLQFMIIALNPLIFKYKCGSWF